jgi:hypothetical protein
MRRRGRNIRRADWDAAYRERIASERRRKWRRKKVRAEAVRRRKRWYVLPDGIWQRCDPLNKPIGALLPKAWLEQDALKRQAEAAGQKSSHEENSNQNPSAPF